MMAVFIMAAGLIAAGTAYAISIPADAMVAGIGVNNGLNGAYYDAGPFNSIAGADSFVQNNDPTATFMATAVDYPNGALNTVADSTTLASFLGADAASLSGAGNNDLNESIFRFSGYVSILEGFDQDTSTDSIDVVFTVGSDDGFLLRIGDELVSSFSGPRSFGFSSGAASFASAGLYALDLIYYENYGHTGIEFFSTLDGGGIVPSKYLFKDVRAVPEPSSMLLLAAGLFGIGTAYRRKSKKI